MKKYISIYSLLIVLILGMVSCDDLFDTKPLDSTPSEDILTNEKDAQTLLYGMYSYFKGSSSYGRSLTTMLDIMTDAALASTGFSNQLGDMYSWRINPGTGDVSNIWASHYGAIYNANFLINNLHQIDGDQDNLNRIKGEAYVGRALLHYNLVRLYAKAYDKATASAELGIPYRMDYEIEAPTRNTIEEVYNYIQNDLKDAIELLPVNESYDKTSFTLDFANGLMARVLLDIKDYEGVIEYTTRVIDNQAFSLTSGQAFADMWLNDTGSEIIWRVGYTTTDFGAAPGYNFFNTNNKESLPRPDYIPSNLWLDIFDVNNDIRYSTYSTYYQTDYGWESHLVIKYPTNPLFVNVGTNMPKPMRLAEMYLMRAEAYSYIDEDNARDDLTNLLNHRLTIPQTITLEGDVLKEFIQTERKKELMFEGFYWFDLKRMGKGFTRVPQENTSTANDLSISADDYRWQWPIPTAELNGNENIKQNDGY